MLLQAHIRPRVKRIPERQARRLKAQAPPIGAAMSYRNLIWSVLDKFNDQILESILEDWDQNPVHATGGIKADAIQSTFVTRKVGAFDVGVEEIIDPAVVAQVGYVAERVNQHGATEFKRVVGISTHDIGVGGALNAFRDRNVDLIKSLAKGQLDDVRDVLAKAEAGAWQKNVLRKELQDRFGVTKSKADLLARDQTLKLNGQLTMTRQRNAGVKKYIWTTSRDERVRPMHEELDGTIQTWEDPPIVSEDGRRCHPGDDYQCRCTPFPVLEELDEELDPEFAPDKEEEPALGFHPHDTSVSIFKDQNPEESLALPRGPSSLHKEDVPDLFSPVRAARGPRDFALVKTNPLAEVGLPKTIPDPILDQPVTVLEGQPFPGSKIGQPPLEVPKDVQRSGFAATFAKVYNGISDQDLDYLRDPNSFRSFAAFDQRYQTLMAQGLNPTEIALKEPYPIKINVEVNGTMHLQDGRHRWTTALRYGATEIEALVTQYGPKGGIKWQKIMRVPIKGA
jgi:SPP1 gp7 family putative phage head morphogenesis protein